MTANPDPDSTQVVSVEPGDLQALENIPSFYASGAGAATSGTDLMLLFSSHHLPADQIGKDGAQAESRICGLVTLSLHCAKDLHTLLGEALADWERNVGEIDTPFLKSRRSPSK